MKKYITLDEAKKIIAEYDKKFPNAPDFPYWTEIESTLQPGDEIEISNGYLSIYRNWNLIWDVKYTFNER